MSSRSRKAAGQVDLGDEALAGIAAALSRVYAALYDGQPLDPRVSVGDEALVFAFVGGLTKADGRLIAAGGGDRLRRFRDQFFDVARPDLVAVVAELTGLSVGACFHGFDVETRTTHVAFVLDATGAEEAEERRALLAWGDQVRRNGRRNRGHYQRTREASVALREQVRERREELSRRGGAGSSAAGSDDR